MVSGELTLSLIITVWLCTELARASHNSHQQHFLWRVAHGHKGHGEEGNVNAVMLLLTPTEEKKLKHVKGNQNMMVTMLEYNKSPAAFMMFSIHSPVSFWKTNFTHCLGDCKGMVGCPSLTDIGIWICQRGEQWPCRKALCMYVFFF